MFSLHYLNRIVSNCHGRSRGQNDFRDGHLALQLEVLEDRYLLSGNVNAFVSGESLFVTGDELGNSVQIGAENGNVVVQGIDNTTINGSAQPFLAFSATSRIGGSLFVHLRQGNDQLLLDNGLTINHSAFLYGNSGNDSIGLDQVIIEDHLILFASSGDDQIALNNTQIGRDAVLHTESGNDVVSSADSRIGNHFMVFGGGGDDGIVLENTTVNRDAILITSSGDDAISVRDSIVSDDLITVTGSGNDFLEIDPTIVGDHTVIDLGSGDDAAMLTGANQFNDHALLVGGAGTNSIEVAAENRFADDLATLLFANDTVADALVESRLNNPQTGLFAKAAQAQQIFGNTNQPQTQTFTLAENSAVGTNVGKVASSAAGPVIFQFDDTTLADELKLNADDHLEGDPTAPVVLIEYLSLQCPACAAAHPDIEQLLADNPDDLLVVRRHFPADSANGGPFTHSFQAALASEAANRQGMFDEMVDQLFARQSEWTNSVTSQQAQAVFEDIAVNTLGLNLAQFVQDMNDPALTDRINRDISDAGDLGVTGIPTFFLNGELTSGTPSSTDIQSAAQAVDRTFLLNRLTGDISVGDDSSLNFDTNPTFTFDVTATNGSVETISVTVNLIATSDLTLTVNTDANATVQSSDTLLVNQSSFTISGTTSPGATVEIARDGDNLFDDASVVADATGNYSTTVQLVHDDANRGTNNLQVRATKSAGEQLTESVNVHYAVGTVVRFASTEGDFDIELYDDDAPITVANFLGYLDRFANLIVQRSSKAADGSDFVIQAGRFAHNGTTLVEIDKDPPIQNEFSDDNPNVRGTLSTALNAVDINSATSEWFINMSDANTFLNARRHTVFGRVIGAGMDVADTIHDLPIEDLNAEFGQPPGGPLSDVPLKDFVDHAHVENFVIFNGIDVLLTPPQTFGAVTSGSFRDPSLLGVSTFLEPGAPDISDDHGAEHVLTAVDYSSFSNPPTYGPHHGVTAGITPRPTGVYTTEQPDEDLVHNLEHGNIWISYNPSLLSDANRIALEFLVNDGGQDTGVILTPRPKNTSAIALASWGHLLELDRFEEAEIRTFIETNIGHGPEGFIPGGQKPANGETLDDGLPHSP